MGWGKLTPFGGTLESNQPYGIVAIGAFVFFSYIGFDTATTTAEECKNPQWDVPVGVIGALAMEPSFTARRPSFSSARFRGNKCRSRIRSSTRSPRSISHGSTGSSRSVCSPSTDQRRAKLTSRPNAHLLCHGARQDASAGRCEGEPSLPNSRRYDRRHRHLRGDSHADRAAQSAAQPREHRDVDRVHGRFRRRALPAQTQTEYEAQLQGTVRSGVFRSSKIYARCFLQSSASRA